MTNKEPRIFVMGAAPGVPFTEHIHGRSDVPTLHTVSTDIHPKRL